MAGGGTAVHPLGVLEKVPGARDLRLFLREEVIRKPRRTAIVCSNDPSEARALADRVLFLEAGKLHGEAPPERIEAELGL